MSENPNYYLNETVPEDERRDVAFQTVNGIREALTLAKNGASPVTYVQAFGAIYELNPSLYNSIVSLLTGKNESELVKYYKEMALVESAEEEVSAVDLIDIDLVKLEATIEKASINTPYLIRKKIALAAAREHFAPRKLSENKSLNHDFYLKSRYEYFGKPLYDGDDYKDFKISKNKVLRLRLLHPDNDEAIIGVDMVYEHFDLEKQNVRFAHMQYKCWDDRVLYSSQASNLMPQLNKMKTNLCDQGFCVGSPNEDRDYRFPYCSGFLRPTSKLQKPDSSLASNGAHLPICQAIRILNDEGKVTKEDLKERSIKGHIFEELFINSLSGSRWITVDSLDKFYTQRGILSHANTIRIHAQEVDVKFDYEKQQDLGR